MALLELHADFDPYSGRKLYSYLYDLHFEDIEVNMTPHHLIYGELKDADAFNWIKKVQVVVNRMDYRLEEYNGNFESFYEDFINFFSDKRLNILGINDILIKVVKHFILLILNIYY